MAKASDYSILTFQRKPGRWRANVTPLAAPNGPRHSKTMLGFVTAEDCDTEEDAVKAANQAIRDLG
ncbi:hypothetical protein [Rhodopseudomonas palustris]|uniref:hypothetical protein n=1 Tax=Rhodopseudomonas palustris TaxID=1076 RepID=UPI000312EB9A